MHGGHQDGQLHSLHPAGLGSALSPGAFRHCWQLCSSLAEAAGTHRAPSLGHDPCHFPAVHQEGEGAEQHWLYMHKPNSSEMSQVPEGGYHPIFLHNRFILLKVQTLH